MHLSMITSAMYHTMVSALHYQSLLFCSIISVYCKSVFMATKLIAQWARSLVCSGLPVKVLCVQHTDPTVVGYTCFRLDRENKLTANKGAVQMSQTSHVGKKESNLCWTTVRHRETWRIWLLALKSVENHPAHSQINHKNGAVLNWTFQLWQWISEYYRSEFGWWNLSEIIYLESWFMCGWTQTPMHTTAIYYKNKDITDSVLTGRGLERNGMRSGGGKDGDTLCCVYRWMLESSAALNRWPCITLSVHTFTELQKGSELFWVLCKKKKKGFNYWLQLVEHKSWQKLISLLPVRYKNKGES